MTTYEGSRFDAGQFDSKMNEQFASEKEDAFTSYDEVLRSHRRFSKGELCPSLRV
nr:eukaryotic initiation factor 4A-8-like [Tanacetum cinerariifolium]